MLTKPIRKVRKVTLKVNKESYRIARRDERNFTIEQLSKSKPGAKTPDHWFVNGYYGNLNDLAYGLIKITTGIPHHEDLIRQIELLREELKSVEKQIVESLTPLMEEVENV